MVDTKYNSFIHIFLLLIGLRGAGKSTLINAILNRNIPIFEMRRKSKIFAPNRGDVEKDRYVGPKTIKGSLCLYAEESDSVGLIDNTNDENHGSDEYFNNLKCIFEENPNSQLNGIILVMRPNESYVSVGGQLANTISKLWDIWPNAKLLVCFTHSALTDFKPGQSMITINHIQKKIIKDGEREMLRKEHYFFVDNAYLHSPSSSPQSSISAHSPNYKEWQRSIAELNRLLKHFGVETVTAKSQEDYTPAILFVGNTGVGKTNLIKNMIRIAGQGLTGAASFTPVLQMLANDRTDDRRRHSGGYSQMIIAQSYDLKYENIKIHFIDTAGFGDSRSDEAYFQLLNKIVEFVFKNFPYITRVCLVAGPDENRFESRFVHGLRPLLPIFRSTLRDKISFCLVSSTSSKFHLSSTIGVFQTFMKKNNIPADSIDTSANNVFSFEFSQDKNDPDSWKHNKKSAMELLNKVLTTEKVPSLLLKEACEIKTMRSL